MAFKDIWKDLQDATEGIAGSGDDASAKPINKIAHAVIDNETNLVGKVDKVTGKGLSSNDFTDDDKSKLDGLSNYDDTEIIRLISEEATARSTADEGKADKTEVAENDNALKLDITALKEKSIPHTTASSYPISLTDHLNDEQVIDYKIYGNSVQDGTPSTDSPVEIQSVGDLVTDTASEHYGKYEVPVKVSGKNLFKYADAEFANAKLIEHILDEDGNKIGAIIQGNSSSNPGTASYANGWFNPGNVPAKGSICPKLYTGQTVTVSVDYKILEANENFDGRVGLFFSNRDKESYITVTKSITAGKQYRLSHTFTITSENNGCTFFPRVTLNSCKVEVKNFQIEFGTANTDYEPYQEPLIEHIYLDEPLRKIGDYADYIDYKNKKVVRNIYKRVFVGTENWIDTNVGRFYLIISSLSALSSNGVWCLCNRLIAQTWDTIWNNYKLQDGSYVVGIARKSDALQVTPYQTKPTLDEWKAQLATWNEEGNPFIVWYVDSPREEAITVPDLTISNSEAANVFASTSTQPSGMDVTYYQDINKIITELKNAILAQGGNV